MRPLLKKHRLDVDHRRTQAHVEPVVYIQAAGQNCSDSQSDFLDCNGLMPRTQSASIPSVPQHRDYRYEGIQHAYRC